MGGMGEVCLSSGMRMPLVGMGTATFPFSPSVEMKEAILHAMELGYRHFDAAAVYNSEQILGEAIEEAMGRGIIHTRQQLFITSKLWCTDAHGHLVLPALHKSLQNLRLAYVDLYLIHFPASAKPGEIRITFDKDEIIPFDMESVWEAMEECQRFGLTKSIGVSNFSCKKLIRLLSTSKIPPAVNQVEMHALWQQKKLREFCMEKGIHVSAYSPLGGRDAPWGTNKVMECEVLKEIAKAKGKTVAQICLRWVYEQGVSLLVKSFNKERLRENLLIFDWALTEEESHKISLIPQAKGCLAELFVSDSGPYKSIEEFWDGEV
ncbi:hypothetical protein AAC387_Pa09g1721 [Persea americana]